MHIAHIEVKLNIYHIIFERFKDYLEHRIKSEMAEKHNKTQVSYMYTET